MKKQLLCMGMILVVEQVGAAAPKRSHNAALEKLNALPEPSKRSVALAALRHPINTIKVLMNQNPSKAARREVGKISDVSSLYWKTGMEQLFKPTPKTRRDLYYRTEYISRGGVIGKKIDLNMIRPVNRKKERQQVAAAKEVTEQVPVEKRITHYNDYKNAMKHAIQKVTLQNSPRKQKRNQQGNQKTGMSKEQALTVLELEPTASKEQIAKKVRALALKYHPDKNPDAEEKMKLINQAYSTLK